MPKLVRRKRKSGEQDLMQAIRERLSYMTDVLLWRNNVGVLPDERGIPIRFGLCVGSADLIGSVRTKHGTRPLAIEVKQPGALPTQDQVNWLNLVRTHGWAVGIAHSVEEAVSIVEGARTWAAPE